MRNLLFSLLLMFSGLAQAATFDQGHEQWSTLLARHVAWDAVGFASAVDYRGFKRDEADLDRYLGAFGSVARPVRQLEQAATVGFLDQQLQRLHRQTDNRALPVAVDQGNRRLAQQSLEAGIHSLAWADDEPRSDRAWNDPRAWGVR